MTSTPPASLPDQTTVAWRGCGRAGIFALFLFQTALAWAADIDDGRRLYEHGIVIGGSPLRAASLGQADLVGEAAACVKCHRRSGLGGREGEILIPAVAGPRLFSRPIPAVAARRPGPAMPIRADSRDAYDETTLARAVRTGIDASGRPLGELMPRYVLDDRDMRNLVAYLRQLSASPVPGAEPGHLRLATILTPDADPDRCRIVEETVKAWAARGSLSNLSIDIDTWRLAGSPADWPGQLRESYRRQPVFAVLSGAGAGEWTPVADFCEHQQLPCIFPVVDRAPDEESRHFSVYLDSGLPLEARLLAKHLRRPDEVPPRIVQVIVDIAGESAADLFASSSHCRSCITRHWDDGRPDATVADLTENDVVIAWLKPSDLNPLLARLEHSLPQVYASGRLASPAEIVVPEPLRPRMRWISTRIEPRRMAAQNAVWLTPWLGQMQLSDEYEPLRAEIYAALHFFGDALARMRGNWNREYLLETIETGMYSRPAGQVFYGLSLAPGQRVAAKAGHVLGLLPPDFKIVVPLGGRLTP